MVRLKKRKVCWLSAGVSSFIAGWLERETIDDFIYIDVADQDKDSMRFIKDCEKALGKEVTILKSEYESVENCVLMFNGFRHAITGFAPCTNWLKKRVRKDWEDAHWEEDITYVWGMDSEEQHRAERLVDGMGHYTHQFPLIERGITKQEAHGILKQLGIKRPKMYEMGYNNNNCIGCVKGGMGYWNKIRKDFPDVFQKRAELERKVGHSIIKGVYLDELDPERGRMSEEISTECDIFCMLNTRF